MPPADSLPLYKKFLKIEEHRLRLRHQYGGGGREICALRVELIDVLMQHIFEAAVSLAVRDRGLSPTPLAVLALGGYGRRELNPFSDVDIMFLHEKGRGNISASASQVIEQILYLLWDVGFKVGHSTRSIAEAVEQANKDMLTKTAMLESRSLAGDTSLAVRFRTAFRQQCVRGHVREYIELRMQDQATRHAKFGDTVYVQEPHLKSGCGGLRDYQNLLWMTFFKEGALTTTHLVGKDWLSEPDQRRIEAAYDFLLRLRTDLHYATGRATDTLHFNVQDQVAQRLGYTQRRATLRQESLMKDYYEHTRNIFRVTERITEQFASGRSSSTTRSLFSFLPRLKSAEEQLRHFRKRAGDDDGSFRGGSTTRARTEPGLVRLVHAQSRADHRHISQQRRAARDFPSDRFSQRRSGPRPAHDASRRFSWPLRSGVRPAHLPGAA